MKGDAPQAPVAQEARPEVKDVSQIPQQPPTDFQATSRSTPPTKPKKRLKLIILIASIILIGLGIGGFLVYKSFFVSEIEKTEEGKPVEMQYKGIWMPAPDPVFVDLDKAAEAGINTLAFQICYLVNDQGELRLPPEQKEFTISFIEEAHARGFKIWLNPEIVHESVLDKGGGSELRIMSEELIENTNLIENFKDGIIEIAKLAEEHDVEIFSPSSEMYVNLDFEKKGNERSRKLLVEIKPRLDAVYSGKICLRGEWPGDELSEYSCFGPGIGMIKNEEERKELVNKIEWSTKDKEIELIIGELYEGHDWEGMSPEEIKRGFEMALEAVEGKVSGVFILDTPRPTPLFPESFESTIKEFYAQEF